MRCIASVQFFRRPYKWQVILSVNYFVSLPLVSHGLALGAIVDGATEFVTTEADLQLDLDRRKPVRHSLLPNVKKKTKLKFYQACLKAKPQVRRLVY